MPERERCLKAGILNAHERECVLIFLSYHGSAQKSKIHSSTHKNNIVSREQSNLASQKSLIKIDKYFLRVHPQAATALKRSRSSPSEDIQAHFPHSTRKVSRKTSYHIQGLGSNSSCGKGYLRSWLPTFQKIHHNIEFWDMLSSGFLSVTLKLFCFYWSDLNYFIQVNKDSFLSLRQTYKGRVKLYLVNI